MKMPIFLPHEMETEIFGNGHGFICITQKDAKKETIIWLTIHQFETIWNHQKTLLREAVTPDDTP
jgi:hypothetical protein